MKYRPSLGAVAIWAISWWPAINFCTANLPAIQRNGVGSLTGIIAISLLLASTGHAIYRWRSNRKGIVLLWVTGVCLTFGYLALRDATARLFEWAGVNLPPSLGWFVIVAIALPILWRIRKNPAAQRAATAFAVVATLAASAMLGARWFETDRASPDAPDSGAAAQASAVVARTDTNVFYIVLDTYAGVRSLNRDFGFDNSAFLANMASRGFRDLSTESSNYIATAQTLAGIFDLDYPETEDPATWRRTERRYPDMLAHATPPPLLARFQANGYSTWFSGGLLMRCPAHHMNCVRLTRSGMDPYTLQTFLAPTPVGRLFVHLLDSNRDALAPVETFLPALVADGRPSFVFAHHLSPHPPFTLDANCERRADNQGDWEVWDSAARPAYLEALQCVNKQVERLMDAILAQNPTAIVVLQGDHGAGFSMDWKAPVKAWSDASIRERASFLNLVRAPARCQQWLDRPLGQINTARFVLACIEGRAPDYLPERTYLSSFARGAEAGSVSVWRPAGAAVLAR